VTCDWLIQSFHPHKPRPFLTIDCNSLSPFNQQPTERTKSTALPTLFFFYKNDLRYTIINDLLLLCYIATCSKSQQKNPNNSFNWICMVNSMILYIICPKIHKLIFCKPKHKKWRGLKFVWIVTEICEGDMSAKQLYFYLFIFFVRANVWRCSTASIKFRHP